MKSGLDAAEYCIGAAPKHEVNMNVCKYIATQLKTIYIYIYMYIEVINAALTGAVNEYVFQISSCDIYAVKTKH